MNEILGNNIMRLRKEHDLTQEQLANGLGITYQAVSKWETGVSSPDISMLPLLADVFEVSIDELFGRVSQAGGYVRQERRAEEQPAAEGVLLPWPDDENMLHAVLFAGHRLIDADEKGERLYSRKQIEFRYEGPALNIWSDFSVQCGAVQGDVNAGGDVDCDDVAGNLQAGGDVDCGNVEGSVSAGGDVDCGRVGGSVSAGGDVDCGKAGGSVHGSTVNGETPEDGEFHSNLKDKKRGFSFELKL